MHQIAKSICFSARIAVSVAQCIENSRWVENEDVVGAAPTGDAPTTSECSTILLPTKLRLILGVWWFIGKPVIKDKLVLWICVMPDSIDSTVVDSAVCPLKTGASPYYAVNCCGYNFRSGWVNIPICTGDLFHFPEAVVWLSHLYWSNLGIWKIYHFLTTTKHNNRRPTCVFLGVYFTYMTSFNRRTNITLVRIFDSATLTQRSRVTHILAHI